MERRRAKKKLEICKFDMPKTRQRDHWLPSLYYTVSDKKIEPVHFCKKIAFWLFGFSLVKLRKIHFFTYQKILLSSRAFQISGFRQERVNRSGDMCSRRAFTHPTSEKLIAGLKLAIAIFNSVRVEGDRVCLPGFTGHFIPWEGRIFRGLWVERSEVSPQN